MRDDFTAQTKDLLARRVALRCSNPACGHVTSGPQDDPSKAINIGVAAHITAAAPGGPRYDPTLTSEQRRSPENGIWLCQACAKLVDNDPLRYPKRVLRQWKTQAEATSARQLERRFDPDAEEHSVFARLEGLMPDLLAEMRADLVQHPLHREFVLLKKGWSYWAKGTELAYYFDEHADLENKILILANHGLVEEVTYNNVKRYVIMEALAAYLGAP